LRNFYIIQDYWNIGGIVKNLIYAIFFLLIVSSVNASVIGVSPSIARFPKMLKNGYAERQFTISTSIETPIKGHFEIEGEIADWITLPDKDFVFSKDSPYVFTLIMQPSADAKNGNYSGILKMRTDELASVERGAGSSVIAQVGLLLYVEVIGDEIIDCRAGAISVSSAEINDPFTVQATVYNDGNVRLRPHFIVDIWDQYRTQVIFSHTFLGDQILPTRSKKISKEIENNLETGQYFADVLVKECGVTKKTTFDIVEKGQIADSGELIGIRTNDISFAKEPMPIVPVFRNLGSRKVLAQFKGEIRDLQTDKIVKILESEQLEVNPKEIVEFKMFFIPQKESQYQVSGRVIYNNKITFEEQSKVVKIVKPESRGFSWLLFFILYIIIGFLILILLGKIRKATKKRRKKHR